MELSFYWALCISQFFDVKRKDFWEMFIHHVTTIALMGFSWTCNLTRVGTLVLVIHDCADIFLEVIIDFSRKNFGFGSGSRFFRFFAHFLDGKHLYFKKLYFAELMYFAWFMYYDWKIVAQWPLHICKKNANLRSLLLKINCANIQSE